MSIAVLGAGAFGTALAVSLAQKGPVTLWARDAARAREMGATRKNPRLPGVALPEGIQVTSDLNGAARHPVVLLATPMQTLSSLLNQIDGSLNGTRLVACCKGIDLRSGCGPTEVIALSRPLAIHAVLTGPSFAADIARGLPTALTLACDHEPEGKELQQALSTPTLRLYRTEDVIGAEMGGALKNVIAIACGVTIGAGLGDSARAALMTRGFAEMTRFAVSRGGRAETLAGLSGLGDLALTCTSELSRNYRFGCALGQGQDFDPSVTVEGAATARALAASAQAEGLHLPIAGAVAALVEGRLTVREVVQDFLTRPLKEE